jgi:hypothetical protein
MSFKYFTSLLVISVILAACGGTTKTATEPPVATEKPKLPTAYPEPVASTIEPFPYPEPGADVIPTNSAYPDPGSSVSGTPVIPPSGYEAQPGDENLKRDQVFLELANSQFSSEFSTANSATYQEKVVLQGNLPDPCHRLRVVVTPPDANNVINLDVYSVVDPGVACITVLKPFTASIPLGSYSDDEVYTVMVNGEKLGEFSAGGGTAPAVPVTP